MNIEKNNKETLSLVIPYFESVPEKRAILKQCIDAVEGMYDELIIVNDIESRGPTRAIIQGFAMSHGDYIACLSDDAFLEEGNLRDLMDPDSLVSPRMNQKPQSFWGMAYCMPRWIYEKVGVLDEAFDGGIYYDDEDYYLTLKKNNIPHYCNADVNFMHPDGGKTVKADPTISEKEKRNRKVFENKWGPLSNYR